MWHPIRRTRYHVYFPMLLLTTQSFLAQDKKSLPAGEVVERIRENITTSWQESTVDTFKGGGPDIEIRGIATTFLATLEVLQQAHRAGLNMVITHEPTFYNHLDETAALEGDKVLQAKRDFIRENNMVVFRFHDHIHQTSPDGIYKGVVEQLGWASFERSERPYCYEIPKTTLRDLVSSLNTTFPTANIRVVGDPDLSLEQVGLVLGAAGSARQIASLQRPDVQALIVGETHEWETVEYVRDAITAGEKKALILLGHAVSEEGGMAFCATWLRNFISEVPIEFIPAGDPFWAPEK